jgi:hypothetical protein
MTALLVVYVIAGCVVYLVTDTTALAGKLSGSLVGPSYGQVRRVLFPVVVATWPLWLVAMALRSKG